ncbi:MAG TPA: hypothetical protein VF618_26695 [Thermoanaerobaculia bacterium]
MGRELPFAFHANALAVGGLFTKPRREVISSEGSMVLAPTGGGGSVTVENYNYRNLITCDLIVSSVTGNFDDDGVYRTAATVQLAHFNAFNVIRASLIQATVFSEHRREDHKRNDDSHISFRAQFLGLTINNVPVEPELDLDLYNQHPTYDALRRALGDRRDLRQTLAHVDENHTLRSSLIRGMSKECDNGKRGLQRDNFMVKVQGFGRVYLGEVLVKKGRRRLNMIRVELDPSVTVPGGGIDQPGRDRIAGGDIDLRRHDGIVADPALAGNAMPPAGFGGAPGAIPPALGNLQPRSLMADAAGADGSEGSTTIGTCETNGADFLP